MRNLRNALKVIGLLLIEIRDAAVTHVVDAFKVIGVVLIFIGPVYVYFFSDSSGKLSLKDGAIFPYAVLLVLVAAPFLWWFWRRIKKGPGVLPSTPAKTLNYFNGNFDIKHKVAFTGTKTMIYADPARYFKTSYNYSENKDIEELTRLFQGISNTIEHGRKLQFVRRFDKLGLEKELKGMEEMARNGYLAEIQIIAPTLQNIANDSSVLHIARERAQRLLQNLNSSHGITNSPL